MSVRSAAVGLDDEQHRVLLVGGAPHDELSVAAPDRRCDDAGAHQFGDATSHVLLAWPGVAGGGEECVLRLRPRLGAWVFGVLEPPVRVGDGVTVEGVDEVEALGIGVRRGGGVRATYAA